MKRMKSHILTGNRALARFENTIVSWKHDYRWVFICIAHQHETNAINRISSPVTVSWRNLKTRPFRENTITGGYSFVLHTNMKRMKSRTLTGDRVLTRFESTNCFVKTRLPVGIQLYCTFTWKGWNCISSPVTVSWHNLKTPSFRETTITGGHSSVLHTNMKRMKSRILAGNRVLAQFENTTVSWKHDYRWVFSCIGDQHETNEIHILTGNRVLAQFENTIVSWKHDCRRVFICIAHQNETNEIAYPHRWPCLDTIWKHDRFVKTRLPVAIHLYWTST